MYFFKSVLLDLIVNCESESDLDFYEFSLPGNRKTFRLNCHSLDILKFIFL